MDASLLLQNLKSKQERMEEELISWCNINSYSHNPEGLARMSEVLKGALSSFGEEVVEIDLPEGQEPQVFRKALSVKKRPKAPRQVFLCIHYDTVYTPESPFQKVSKIKPNVLNGPGVADAKGGLMIMLEALKAFEDLPGADGVGWEVFLNPDEEIGSFASAKYLSEAGKKYDLGLLFEPSLPNDKFVRSRPGSGHFYYKVKGLAAHAGRDYKKGKNAIYALAPIIRDIAEYQKEHPDQILNMGNVTGGGQLNIVPDKAVLALNVRVLTQNEARPVEEKLRSIADQAAKETGLEVALLGEFHRMPKEVTTATEQIFKGYCRCAEDLGSTLDWEPSGGCSDGNNLASAGLPNLDSLGARGGKIHTVDEFLVTDSLSERSALTALFLHKLAKGEIKWNNM